MARSLSDWLAAAPDSALAAAVEQLGLRLPRSLPDPPEPLESTSAAWPAVLGLVPADPAPAARLRWHSRNQEYLARKWEQLRRLVPLICRLRFSAAPAVRVADVASGRGFVAFGAHYGLQAVGCQPVTVAIERDSGKVADANKLAQALPACAGLRFAPGEASGWLQEGGLEQFDLVTSLHGCAGATDDALALGVRSGAEQIVLVPCCRREVFKQVWQGMRRRPELHPLTEPQELFKAAVDALEDSVRVLVLEGFGYDCDLFEFVPREFAKMNVAIVASKRPDQGPEETARRAAARERAVWLLERVGVGEHRACRWLGLELSVSEEGAG